MAEFTVIETQEQLDKIIGDRIKRAEAAAEKKFADYEDLKKQNENYAKQLAELTEQIKQQTETINTHDATVAELNAKIHQYETSSVKTKVALEYGIPYQMSSRLAGDDEEAIRADAETMVKLFENSSHVAPLGSSEPINTNINPEGVAKAKFAEWMKQINNQ